jgi:hypothetical protein
MANDIETDTPMYESFDHGLGALGHHWGGDLDWSVPGEVTLRGHGGFMEFPGGPSAGHGYGTYTVQARLDGTAPGPAALLWPGDDSWPGQEIDIVEVHPDGSGRHYGVLHWDDGSGWDNYESLVYDDIHGGVFRDYTVVWEPGRITYVVDGAVQGEITQNVPRDYDDGGMNNVIGIMNTNPDTSITVREVGYDPLGEAGGWVAAEPQPALSAWDPAPEPAWTPAPEAPAATDPAAVDWNAIAAQVMANHASTGAWYA